MPLWPFNRKSASSKRGTTRDDIQTKDKIKSRQGTSLSSPVKATAATRVADGSGIAAADNSDISTNINSNIVTITSNNTTISLRKDVKEIGITNSAVRRKRNRLSKRNTRGRDSSVLGAAAAVFFRHNEQQEREEVKTANQELDIKDKFEQQQQQPIRASSGDNFALPLQQPPPTPASRARLSRSSTVSSSSSSSSISSSSSSASSLALSPRKVEPNLVEGEHRQRRRSTEDVTALPKTPQPQLSPHLRPVTRERQDKRSASQSTGTLTGYHTTTTGTSSANIPQRSASALSFRQGRRNRFTENNAIAVTAATTASLRRRLSKRARHEAQQQERQREAEIREMTAVATPSQVAADLKRPASRTDILLSRKNSKKVKNADGMVLSSTASLPVRSPLPSTDMTADTDAHAFELGSLEVFSPRPPLRISVAHHQEQFRNYHYRNYNMSNSHSNVDSRSQQYMSSHLDHDSQRRSERQQQPQQPLHNNEYLHNCEDDTTSPKTRLKSTRPITPSVTTQQYQKHISNVTRSLSRRKGKRPDQITEKLKRSQHRTVDSLANELDSGALREVMERDQRRRERKVLADAEKARRRLAKKPEHIEQQSRQSRQQYQQREAYSADSQRGSPKQKVKSRRKRNVIVENIDEDKENFAVWSPPVLPSASLVSPSELSPDLKLVLPPSPPALSPARKLKGGNAVAVAAAAAAAAAAPIVPVSRKAYEAEKAVSYSRLHAQPMPGASAMDLVTQSNFRYGNPSMVSTTDNKMNVGYARHQASSRGMANTDNARDVEEKVNPASAVSATAESNAGDQAHSPEVVVGTARAVRLSQASMSSVGKQLSVSLSSSPPPPSSPPFVPDGLKQQRAMSASSIAQQQQQLSIFYDSENGDGLPSERWGSDESKLPRRSEEKVVNVWNNVNITPEPTPPLPPPDKAAERDAEEIPPVPDMPTHMPHASVESVSHDLMRLQQLQQQQQREKEERRKREHEWARKLAGRVVSDVMHGDDSVGAATTPGEAGRRLVSGDSTAAGATTAPRRNRSLRRGGDGGGSTWRSLFRRSGSSSAARVTSGSSNVSRFTGTSSSNTTAGLARKNDSSDVPVAGLGALSRTMTPSEFSFSNTSREEILLLRQSGGDSQHQQQQQQGGRTSHGSYKRTSGPEAAYGTVTGAGGVMRRRSKFREDLPELPLSPPDSRLDSPIEKHEIDELVSVAAVTSSRSATGTAPAASVVAAATENMILAAASLTPKKEARVHRVVSLARYGSNNGGGDGGEVGELGRSGSGAISARRRGRSPANILVGAVGGGDGGITKFGSNKDLPSTPSHQKSISNDSLSNNIMKTDDADPTSTTSLLASPGSEGSWLTGRGTNNLKNNDKQRAAQQLHVQYQENLNRQGTDGAQHQDSVRSSQELDDGNVITNDDYFRRLAMVQLPAPPPIPDDDPAYSPPSGRIPSSIVVGRAGEGSRSGERGGSGSSQASLSGDDHSSRSRSSEGRGDGAVGAEEDEDTVRTLRKDAGSTAAAIPTITTTTVTASTSLKEGLSPLLRVKGLDVGVNAGVAIPPDAESNDFSKANNAVGRDNDANAKRAYATEYDYDYYDEGTFVQETEARRPVTLTHRRDAEKIHSREVFLDRVWDADDSRRASAIGDAYDGIHTGSGRGSALVGDTGGVAAAAARLVGRTDQPTLDVTINDGKNSSSFGYDDKNGDDKSSPTYAVVRNARSVDLRNSAEYKHAKHLSAGSAKLLDIGSNSAGNGSKRQSADSSLTGAANVAPVAATTSKADAATVSESMAAATTTTTTTSIATATASTTAGLPSMEMASSADAATAATTTAPLSKTTAQHATRFVLPEQTGDQDNPPRGRTLLSPASIGAVSHPSSELRSSSGGDSYRFL